VITLTVMVASSPSVAILPLTHDLTIRVADAV